MKSVERVDGKGECVKEGTWCGNVGAGKSSVVKFCAWVGRKVGGVNRGQCRPVSTQTAAGVANGTSPATTVSTSV